MDLRRRNIRSSLSIEGRGWKSALHIRSQVFLILFALLSRTRAQEEVGDFCATEDGEDGTCRPLVQCPSLVALPHVYYGAGERTPGLCSYGSRGTIVCCPSGGSVRTKSFVEKLQPASPTPADDDTVVASVKDGPLLRISEQKCLEYKKVVDDESSPNGRDVCLLPPVTHLYIIGGSEVTLGEYPHMAALGYAKGPTVQWLCGGTLISPNYILTAAHCYKDNSYGRLAIARLGELLIKKTRFSDIDTDLVTRTISSGDYAVERVIRHPEYRSGYVYNDIALVRLLQPVQKFDKMVRPACLYTEPEPKGLNNVTATGWGFTEDNDDVSTDRLLQQVDLKLYDRDLCNKLYAVDATRSSFARGVEESMICAGDLAGGKDTCQGDSGGPLQIKDPDHPCMFRILGVTSLGKNAG